MSFIIEIISRLFVYLSLTREHPFPPIPYLLVKKVTLILSALLLLAGSTSLPLSVTAKPQGLATAYRFPTPEAAEAFGNGREAARAWLADWRARGADAAEYNAEYQDALANEQSAEYNSLDYYYYFGYRTGLTVYK